MEIPKTTGAVAAFCGIARPGQFFAGLAAAGISVASQTLFSDHHRYTVRDAEKLADSARAASATEIITTEKDEVRLGGLTAKFATDLPLKTVRLHVEIEDEQPVFSWLEEKLSQAQPTVTAVSK
jgi:tetraacyldisaccharide 4'-kinase